jgi:hypothetical protein
VNASFPGLDPAHLCHFEGLIPVIELMALGNPDINLVSFQTRIISATPQSKVPLFVATLSSVNFITKEKMETRME